MSSEGSDDMPSHAKSSIIGVNINIHITQGRLNLGTWQGIYLCEFRNYGGSRHISNYYIVKMIKANEKIKYISYLRTK